MQVASIRSSRRWALSATPFPNGPGCLEGQLVCLQMAPYDLSCVFRSRLDPLHNGLWCGSGMAQRGSSEQPMLKLLSIAAIRHLKDSVLGDDGEELVHLPPLTVEERLLEADDAEAAAYRALHAKVAERVEFLERGGALGVRRAHLTSMLLALRMACDHASLAGAGLERLKEEQAKARQASTL